MNRRISDALTEQWKNEPDYVDATIGDYHLIVLRSGMGNLNGYVGVKRNHPYFALDQHSKKVTNLECHGGITFADKGSIMCHMYGFKKNLWYFGFDTCHVGDYVPFLFSNVMENVDIDNFQDEKAKEIIRNMQDLRNKFENDRYSLFNKENYKDINYVSKDVENLYLQLARVGTNNRSKRINYVKEYRRMRVVKEHEKELYGFLKK